MQSSEVPDDATAQRIADETGADNTELIHKVDQDFHFAGIAVVARRVWAGKAKSWQVKTDRAIICRQGQCPRLPGVQAGTETVQQDHRGRVARTCVAQAQAHAVDAAVVAGIRRLQLGAGFVGRIEPVRQGCES